ncbi:MAG TPA: di-heme oxidoredictase family protein [Fimbriiglobus sp.]
MRAIPILSLLFLLSNTSSAGTSNSLLDVTPDDKRLAVANTDSGTVTIVDLQTRKALCELPAGDHPEGVAWVGNGPLLLATVYGDDRVIFYDAEQRKCVKILKVADEPYGVVTTKDGKYAYVTHDYPGTVSEIDVTNRKVSRTFAVGQGCRGVALSPDETRLYVTEFHTAKLLAVELASGNVIDAWTAVGSDNLARNIVIHPTKPRAYAPHLRSMTDIFNARGSIAPHLSVFDLVPEKPGERRRQSIAMDTFNGVYVMSNPWEAALSPDGNLLYIVYAGTDDMSVVRTDDERGIRRINLPYRVGKHPRAVRTSPDGKEVYIYNTLDYEVAVHEATGRRKLAAIPVTSPPQSESWRRGKELFQLARQPMTGPKWIACASCHPDGLSDGRVWQNPEGDRRTPNLFGLAHTHPLHWSADRDEVQDFEFTIRGPLMKGRGLASQPLKGNELAQHTAGLSADLDALADYTNSFPVRLSPHIPGPGKLFPDAERGKAIFFSAKTKCTECHTGPYFTDSSLAAKPFHLHDVGTGGAPREKNGPKYDTPTLLGTYRAGSWLHDGRAKSLSEVFTVHNKGDKHGTTSHLTKGERNDLVAFLKSLPYVEPPSVTPNTVKFRTVLKYPRPKVDEVYNATSTRR